MTAEKYVAEIARKVKCPAKKRKAIRQELLSEIRLAQERGERLEEIMGRMGPAGEVAREFNENLPEEERKRFARRRGIWIALCVALCIAAALMAAAWFLPKTAEIGASGVFGREDVEARMKLIIQQFNDNDFASLKAGATEDMQAVLNEETMDGARGQLSEDWGAFQAFGSIEMAEVTQRGKLYALGQMTAAYENISVTYTISFDRDMKLAGFYMK